MKKRKKSSFISRIYSNPKYKGKHIVAIAGKVYTATTGEEANKILEKVIKKYPKETPTITYIPKEEILIL